MSVLPLSRLATRAAIRSRISCDVHGVLNCPSCNPRLPQRALDSALVIVALLVVCAIAGVALIVLWAMRATA